jgi:hypothetical protein
VSDLADLQNEILSTLQQTQLVNFGGTPNWASVTNPEFDEPTVNYWINRAYLKVMRNVSDIDVAMFSCTFPSVANGIFYALPPPVASGLPNPPCAEVRRLFYTPAGLGYTLEFEPALRMVPWKEFQRYTASGYLQNFSYGTQPQICSVTPDRKQLAFYPGTANAGDTIELQYAPVPTVGTLVPLLANEGDVPYVLPDDFHELISIYALYKLWPKARSLGASADFLKQYWDQLNDLRAMWKRRSGGDRQRFTDSTLDRASSGPWGWI